MGTYFTPEWVTAISTVIYMFFTGWLIYETRKTRKIQEEPQIDAYIDRGEDHSGKLYLVIKNNGRGGAYNIKLSLKEDFDTFKDAGYLEYKKLSFQGPFKNGISFLPPDAVRQMALGIYMGEEFQSLLQKKIDLTISYKNVYGNTTSRHFILGFGELENTILMPDNPLFEIAKELKKIADKFGNFASGRSELNVITQTKDDHVTSVKARSLNAKQNHKT